eukprot:gene10089-biopygen9303
MTWVFSSCRGNDEKQARGRQPNLFSFVATTCLACQLASLRANMLATRQPAAGFCGSTQTPRRAARAVEERRQPLHGQQPRAPTARGGHARACAHVQKERDEVGGQKLRAQRHRRTDGRRRTQLFCAAFVWAVTGNCACALPWDTVPFILSVRSAESRGCDRNTRGGVTETLDVVRKMLRYTGIPSRTTPPRVGTPLHSARIAGKMWRFQWNRAQIPVLVGPPPSLTAVTGEGTFNPGNVVWGSIMPFLWVEWSGVRRGFLYVIDRRGPHVRSPQEDASQNSIQLGNRQGPQHRVSFGGRHILTTGSVRPARHHRGHVRRSSTAAGLPCPGEIALGG